MLIQPAGTPAKAEVFKCSMELCLHSPCPMGFVSCLSRPSQNFILLQNPCLGVPLLFPLISCNLNSAAAEKGRVFPAKGQPRYMSQQG